MKHYFFILFMFLSGICSAQNWSTVGSKNIKNIRSMARLGSEVIAIRGTDQIVKVDYDKGTVVNFIPNTSFNEHALLTDIYVSTVGDIYCVDKTNKQIIVFNREGNKQRDVNVTLDKPLTCYLRSDGILWVGGDGIELYQQGVLLHSIDQLTSTTSSLASVKDFCEINDELYLIDRNRGIFKVDGIAGTKLLDSESYRNSAIFHKANQMASFKNMLMVVAQSTIGEGHGLYEFSTPIDYSAFVDEIGTNKSGAYGVVSMDDYLLISGDNGIKKVNYHDVVAPTLTIKRFEITSDNSIAVDFTCDEDVDVILDVYQGGVKVTTKKIKYAFAAKHHIENINNLNKGEDTYVTLSATDKAKNVSAILRSEEVALELVVKLNQLSRVSPNYVDYYIQANLEGDLYYVLSDDYNNKSQFTTSKEIIASPNVVNAGLVHKGGELRRFNFDYNSNKRIYYVISNGVGVVTKVATRKVMTMDEIDRIRNKVLYTLTGKGTPLSEKWVNKHAEYTANNAAAALGRLGNYQVIAGLTPYMLLSTKGDQDDIDRNHLRSMIINVLFPLAIAYNVNDPSNPYYHDVNVKNGIIQLFKYANARRFDGTCDSEFKGGGIYLTLSGYFYASLLMRDELIKEGFWTEVLATCKHWTEWSLAEGVDINRWDNNDRNRSRNSDLMRSFNRNKLLTILMTGSQKATRATNLRDLSKFIDEGCQLSPGWGGMIKNDFTGYHHHGFWSNAYNADAVREASEMASYLSGTTYELGVKALENLANYWIAYTFYSNKYDVANGVTGRFPTNRSSLLRNSISILSLTKVLPEGNLKEKLQRHFINLWNSTDYIKDKRARDAKCSIGYSGGFGNWVDANRFVSRSKLMPLKYVKGNRTFPYAAFQVHRHNDVMVSVKGFNKYVWDYESNGEQNFFGYHQSHGALEIIGTNDPLVGGPSTSASGWNPGGYDWNHIPGVTGYKMSFATLYERNKKYPWARFSFDYFAGGVSLLDEFGMYGYRFKDVRTLNGKSISLRANKSYTFFGNYVVCVGSNIEGTLSKLPVHTTILQNFLNDQEVPTIVNSVDHKGVAYHHTTTTDGALKIEDTKGNAYYFPNGNKVQVHRELQTSRDDRNKIDTHGSFEKVFIDHGARPRGDRYVYVISLEGKTLNDKIAENPSNYFNILEQSGDAHIIYSKVKNVYGYSFFRAGKVSTKYGVIESTDSDAMAIVKENESYIDLALTHLDLELLDKKRWLHQVWHVNDKDRWNRSKEQLVNIKLRGQWSLQSNAEGRVISNGYNAKTNLTSIQFRPIDAKSLEVRLEKPGVILSSHSTEIDTYRIYPNPVLSQFRISSSKASSKNRVIIYDVLGVKVTTIDNYIMNNPIDISSLRNGLYTVEVYSPSNERLSCQKIVKV
ncbi:chondroitinase family polysaccharide lyase [Prolixibacteraceae bacterium]|nr:chondroitinase family polysaccharide lyase [Prolixibacteraceae bacterium]